MAQATLVSADGNASNDDALLPDPQLQVRGNLEGIAGGCVYGWVFNESNPAQRMEVGVLADGEVVSHGLADQFRADLLSAQLGDGSCAFNVSLPDYLCDGLVHELSVVEKESGMLLGTLIDNVSPFASTAIAKIIERNLVATVDVHSASNIDCPLVEILADGHVCAEVLSIGSDAAHIFTVQAELPLSLLDGNFHLIMIRVKDRCTRSEPVYQRLESTTTRWEHISGSYASLNNSALPKISAYRYRALQSHLRNLNDHSAETLANLQQAHDVVVEGVKRRKKYPKLTLPLVDKPDITVVVPVHNSFEYTYNCIASLILAYNEQTFEVVLVDDKSSDETVDINDVVENIRVVKNEVNRGFLLTAEAGAQAGSGNHIVFLNNDTEVTDGWLDHLFDVFQRFEQVGLAGSKLLYPDGRLQEAGGIIWGDGKPSNLGHGDNAEDPTYNYVRATDYVSGAAMMVTREVWDAVGGFSKEFVPAYYEDTDLAFKVREAGYKTLYVPASVVIHYEGMSNGRDLDSGYKRFQNINAPRFREKWRYAYRNHGRYENGIGMQLDRDKDFRVLMVDYATPRPDQDAGSYAAVQEMRLLQELGCKITFVPNNMAHMGKYTTELQRDGVECLYAPFYNNVGEVLKDRGREFDLVYITRYSVAEEILEYVRRYSKAKVVLNNADLHFLREIRAAMIGKEDDDRAAALETRERELDVVQSVDAVLSYNETEHAVITSHTLKADNIFKCPWVLSEKRLRVPFSERSGIAFLGGYNHLPNREAVQYFVAEVMPLLRLKSPGIEFHIYGSSVPDEIEALAADDVIVKGFVESLDTLFDTCRVFVAPLLSGAGIKGKVLESVSYQVPCVLSPVASESTGLVHNLNAKIAQSPEQWVDAITSVYHDESEWVRLSEKALELVEQRYSKANGLKLMSDMMSFIELDPQKDKAPTFKVVKPH